MIYFVSFIVFTFSFSLNGFAKVYLFSQWHLGSKVNSTNIEKSKSLKQYQGQKDLYIKAISYLGSGKSSALIQEGCEGEINKNFTSKYNGWTMSKLSKFKDDLNYADIMAPIGMKIKAKFPQYKVVCGDNLTLMNKHLLAFSEVRGFSGFYMRLKEIKDKNSVKYKAYRDKLLSLFKGERISNVSEFAKKKALFHLNELDNVLKKRNKSFSAAISKHKKLNPIVIIGDAHTPHLNSLLIKKKIKTEIYRYKGLPKNGHKLLEQLKAILVQ